MLFLRRRIRESVIVNETICIQYIGFVGDSAIIKITDPNTPTQNTLLSKSELFELAPNMHILHGGMKRGKCLLLGFDMPNDVQIDRAEVLEARV